MTNHTSRAWMPDSHHVLAWLAAAGLTLALLAATGTAAAGVRRLPVLGRAALAGKIIGIDPGHNGLNYTDPAFLNHQIWNGREWEGCDTTGTQTGGGYTEARFNWNVATYLRADLIKLGARVVMTRTNNHGIGPCVNTRAEILDRARADVSIEIHADYGPSSGRGNDLAGLNLTTMPKVLIECGNMNNPSDAALLVQPRVQQMIAAALAAAITGFLTAR
jgi:N-acetylmuramoyl-L-alanine amidase